MKYYVAVDLGGTNLRTGLVSQEGELLYVKRTRSMVERGPVFVINNIINMIQRIIDEYPCKDIEGIGMAIPGLLDTCQGLIRFAPNLGWYDVPILEAVQQEFNIPVYFDNDCRVHALGEWYYGAGQGVKNFMVIAIGTGIGSGIILDGKLLRGSIECAGEIGHFKVQDPGAKCNCGKYGCLETVASALGIRRMAIELINKGKGQNIIKAASENNEDITTAAVFQAALTGDPEAAAIIDEVVRCLSIAVNIFFNTLNLEAIILSGGVSMAGPLLLNPLKKKVKEMAEASLGLYKDILNYENIIPAQLGDNAGLIGCAALVQYMLDRDTLQIKTT